MLVWLNNPISCDILFLNGLMFLIDAKNLSEIICSLLAWQNHSILVDIARMPMYQIYDDNLTSVDQAGMDRTHWQLDMCCWLDI